MYERQLNILSQLAYSDQDISDHEKQFITIIGKANGVPEEKIEEIIRNPEPIGDLVNLTDDEKYEYLYNIVQLMKIDGKVYKSEIVFCQEMAEKLGYKKRVISELSAYIYSDPSITTDREALKAKIKRFQQS